MALCLCAFREYAGAELFVFLKRKLPSLFFDKTLDFTIFASSGEK